MSDVHNTLQSGIEAIRRGDKEGAREAFRRVLQDDPNNTQALLWLAGVANTRDEKQRVLERILELDPDNTLAQKGLDTLGVAPASSLMASDTPATDVSSDETPLSQRRRRRVAIAGAGAAAASAVPMQSEVVAPEHEADETDDARRRRSLVWLLLLPICLAALGVGSWYLAQRGIDPLGIGGGGAGIADTATPGDQAIRDAETPGIASYSGPQDEATNDAIPGAVVTGTTAAIIPNVVVESGGGPAVEDTPEATQPPMAPPSIAPSTTAASTPSPIPSLSSPRAAQLATPSPTPATVGTNRPQLLGIDQTLQTGPWEWSYYGLSNFTTGSGYSVQPANGRYLIVLMLVRNTGDAPAQIPDGLFMVTDAQGRSISFNRPISVEYMRRYGASGGDYPANANIPVTNTPVSVPLLFDVAPDATDLIITSASDPNRGYLVRSDMR